MKKAILFAFVWVLTGPFVMAQKKKNTPPPPPVEPPALTKPAPEPEMDYTAVLNAVFSNMNAYFKTTNPNLEPVTRHLSSDFIFVRNTEDVSGMVRSVRWNTEDFLRELKGIKEHNIAAERKIERIVFTQMVGNLANISAVISIRFTQDTTTVGMIYAFATHSMAKEGGKWKVKNMTVDRVTESQSIGVCPCKISKVMADRNDLFTAKVMYPNGTGFETDDININFRAEGNLTIVTFGSNYYTWKEGIVASAKVGENATPEIIGKAYNNSEVITLILAKSLYKSHCARFEPIK